MDLFSLTYISCLHKKDLETMITNCKDSKDEVTKDSDIDLLATWSIFVTIVGITSAISVNFTWIFLTDFINDTENTSTPELHVAFFRAGLAFALHLVMLPEVQQGMEKIKYAVK